MTTRSLRRKTQETIQERNTNLSPRPRRLPSRTVSESPVRVIDEIPSNTISHDGEVAELRKMVKELSKEKGGRKLSALNKFKKYVLSKSTEQALAETDFSDLIPVDKMRLLNKAYPIVWDEMVLKQLYQKYGCENNEEEQEKLRNKKNIQLEYQIIVDNIIDESKAGELDDQEHFREDITKILCYAIREAAKGFKSDEDDKKKPSKDDDEDVEE